MSIRVGKWTGAPGERISGTWLRSYGVSKHCLSEIRADAEAKYQITGEEYLPWDIIRCSCGDFWVLSDVLIDAPIYSLVPTTELKVRRKLGMPLVRWKDRGLAEWASEAE